MATWRETLDPLNVAATFGDGFMGDYGERQWAPTDDDCTAARSLHIELISRIATQALEYSEGVEERALTSVYEMFQRCRTITENSAESGTFETIVWHVLNVHVRPFTARWHPKSLAGALRALDNSDSFRAELEVVQIALRDLDCVLRHITGLEGYTGSKVIDRPDNVTVTAEMDRSATWRPLGMAGPIELAEAERSHVINRRKAYGLNEDATWATGIALSGGGIRSATFSLGVLASLAKRNLLPQFDYLSTVSGGGYTGCFLTQLLAGSVKRNGHGLQSSDKTFARKEGEPEILQSFRQRASYLSGSFTERLGIATAQAYGVLTNVLILILLAGGMASVELVLRVYGAKPANELLKVLSPASALGLAGGLLLVGVLVGMSQCAVLRAALGSALLGAGIWLVLGSIHDAMQSAFPLGSGVALNLSLMLIALAVFAAAAGVALAVFSRVRPFLLSVLTFLLFVALEVLLYRLYQGYSAQWPWLIGGGAGAALLLWGILDVNRTSLHHYYRMKLADAFLLDPSGKAAKPSKLSDLKLDRSPFPIINCSLNAPGSTNPRMRGRKCDLFSLTPVSAGAWRALGSFESIREWEKANPELDLATAMALSGAAVSPQMGLRTTYAASFWLTLLNLRLNLWLRKPGNRAGPGIGHLLQELMANADEKGGLINISDGGHIENLGVYELLRRRCRFILAVDGESDPAMTFHAITNLQRLAFIDLGVSIEVDLNELRVSNSGFSRSHFQLCRIIYPVSTADGQVEEIGYLVYLKLSLTGNEGEFIRRFKLDEPAFPHHSTADQFFTETQFEAYRALGEHVGEKLFLPAIAGRLDADVALENWFKGLGRSLLQKREARPT